MTQHDQQILQFRRRWQLLELLHDAERGLTAAQLLERVPCSRITLYRDLDFLSDCTVGLEKLTVNGEVRHILQNRQLPPLSISPLQALALQLARGLLGPLEGTSAVRELDILLTHIVPKPLASGLVSLGPARVAPVSAINSTIDQAMKQRRQLRILYRGVDDTAPEPRTLDPLRHHFVDGDLYLIAHDRQRQGIRTFKTIRIQHAELLSDPAAPHPEFDEQTMFNGTVKAWSGTTVQVVVRLSPRVAAVAREYPLVDDQRIEAEPDGSVVIHGLTAGIVEAMRWVLGWGRDACVLAPDELRRAVIEQVAGALRQYDEPTDDQVVSTG